MEAEYCCDWMRRLAGPKRERGFEVAAVQDGSRRYFALRAHSVSKEDEAYFRSSDPRTGVKQVPIILGRGGEPVSWLLSQQVAIRHCPGCGAALDDWIARNRELFDTMAAAE